MRCFLYYMADKLWPVILAAGLTQWVAQKIFEHRKPKLEMVPEGEGTGFSGWYGTPSNKYQTWRVSVRHVKVQKRFAGLIKYRDSALQCNADLIFYNNIGEKMFAMAGRWANTKQPPFVSSERAKEMFFYPDRIDIGYHSSEPLDCVVQYHDDNSAYGWNNEAYWKNGKNSDFELGVGEYKVEVKLSGQNFPQVSTSFKMIISKNSTGTNLSPA